MEIKHSCKSQFRIIADEVQDKLQQGYSKKALYDFFKSQNKITMSYSAWTIILNHQTENKPFSSSQKKSILKPPANTIKSVSTNKRGFQHDSNPYPAHGNLKPQKKEEIEINFISKKER